MKTRSATWKSIHFFLMTLSLAIGPAYADTKEKQKEEIFLVTHAETALNKSISRNNLIAIYKMKTRKWPNGQKVTLFILNDRDEIHRDFCIKFLGILPNYLRRNWDRLIFSGRATEPTRVDSLEKMITRIRETPGAIGYLTGNYLDESIQKVDVRI